MYEVNPPDPPTAPPSSEAPPPPDPEQALPPERDWGYAAWIATIIVAVCIAVSLCCLGSLAVMFIGFASRSSVTLPAVAIAPGTAVPLQVGETSIHERYAVTPAAEMGEPVTVTRLNGDESLTWVWNMVDHSDEGGAGTGTFSIERTRRPMHSVGDEPVIVTSQAAANAQEGLHITLVDGGTPPQRLTINGVPFMYSEQDIASTRTVTLVAFIGRDEVTLTGSFQNADLKTKAAVMKAIQTFRLLPE